MYHKMIIVGNLGRDPEMRFTPSGVAVTNLSVATNRVYTNNAGEQVKETIWFRVSVWGKQAEACQQYLSKGRQVLIEGILQGDESGNPRVFQRKDGSWGASFEVRADTVRFIGSRADGQGSSGDGGFEDGFDSGPGQEEDLPF
jgi:single-strand DNA-binding protein